MTTDLLNDFKLRACVDWVAVRVTLARPSQWRHVQARLPARPYVRQVAPMVFEFRVNDPGSPCDVLALVQQLAQVGAPLSEGAIEIIGVEVAVDFIPTTDTARARLALVVAHLAEHLAKPPPGPRLLLHKRRFMAAAGRRAIVSALEEGYTLTIGNRRATDTAHAYVKTYDTQPGQPYAPLPAAMHRARVERTLTGKDCPIRTLQQWREFKFEKLASMLAMVRTTDTAKPLTRLAREQWGPALGKADDPAKRAARRRQSVTATVRDTALNERTRQALRNLTARCAHAEIRWISDAEQMASTEEKQPLDHGSPKSFKTQDTLTLALAAYPAAPAWLDSNPPGIFATTIPKEKYEQQQQRLPTGRSRCRSDQRSHQQRWRGNSCNARQRWDRLFRLLRKIRRGLPCLSIDSDRARFHHPSGRTRPLNSPSVPGRAARGVSGASGQVRAAVSGELRR